MSKKVNEVLNPRNRGSVIEFDIGVAGEEYAKVYGANKNLARITPALIDGLKPVQLRILYDYWDKKVFPDRKPKKTSAIVGDTMARFHPHGDSSIKEAIDSMCQDWSWSIPLLKGESSFGSIRGDRAAAMRYTEARLSEFTMDCYFDDFKESNVSIQRAYTDDEDIPVYLPAKYPIGIINPELSSIGYGFASNIPPFNFAEVIKATLKLMADPNTKINLIPDSPTGADIIDDGSFQEINTIGKSKFTLQASYKIDYMNNTIKIISLPLQINCMFVQKRIIDLHNKGKFDELVGFEEHTRNGVVDFDIILTKDADPDKVIEFLMKKDTGLRKTYSCELRFVHDYRMKIYNPREFILEWLEYDRDRVRAVYNEKITKTIERLHMLEVLIFIMEPSRLDETVDIVFDSKNRTEAEQRLMEKYKISSVQAAVVANMKMYEFTSDKRDEFIEEQKTLTKKVEEYQDILDSDNGVDEVITQQMLEGIKKWGTPRRSKIIKVGKNNNVPDTNHIIGISNDGYIKKLDISKYSSIGYVGKVSSLFTIAMSNRDNLILFDSDGQVTRLPVSSLPDMKYEDIGIRINRYFKSNGIIVSAIRESDVRDHSDTDVVMITRKGFGKKTSLSEFKKIKTQTMAIALEENDTLVSVIPSLDSDSFIIYTDRGDGIRLETKEFKNYKKTAKGLRMISLRSGEEVCGIDMLYSDKKYILYVTSAGKVKLTEVKYFPVMKRKDEPLSLISLDENEILLGIQGVSMKGNLVCYKRKSGQFSLPIDQIPVTTRIARAQKMIKTPKGDDIVGYIVEQ